MIGISGIGVYVPEGRITAAEIAQASGLSEWVVKEKLGLRAKPKPGPEDHPTAMGVWAAQEALEQAQVVADDIDVVISITEEYKEYPVWTAGIKLAHDLGAFSAYAYDLGQKCGSGVLALKQAKDLIRADKSVNTVLVAGGYRNGDLINFANPRVRFMYNLGAGGAAALLQRGTAKNEILESAIITDGSFSLDVLVPVGGTKEPLNQENTGRYKLEVADPAGMKTRLEEKSLANFIKVVKDAVGKSGYSVADIDYLAMLHVKRSAHDYLLEQLELNPEQSIYLTDYGHLGQIDQFLSLKLAEQQGRLKTGDLVVLVAAGVGYVWNAICLRWGERQ